MAAAVSSPQEDRPAAPAGGSGARAVGSSVAIVVFFAVAFVGAAADLLSKHLVFAWMLSQPEAVAAVRQARAAADAERVTVDPRRLLKVVPSRRVALGVKLTLSTNPGVVFGLRLTPWLVVIATAVATLLVLLLFAASPARAWGLHLALAFILAGALGNLYDRLLGRVILPGGGAIEREVRDFIDCSGLYYPPVFNVADALLVVGVAVLLIHSLWAERRLKARKV